ncbi:MAG: gamma-glutamyl-gamma-aminobutyrate hydrolase family protein, partial [Nitrospirae bacterium]|nr:gamma-glutamyl-gamma-aminobutyrate hydrolase family protein [Nitrospirota bacterium]
MKPIIGITADIDEAVYKLKLDYVSAVVNAGGVPVVIPPLEKGGRGDFPMNDIARIADLINGLLVSGGDDLYPEYYNEDISAPLESLRFVRRERSDFETSLLREVIRKQKPVLGICYGMQL